MALTGAAPENTNSINDWYLPGKTTHGHYQIELKCSACHDASGVVQEQSCLDCHARDLKLSKDTHPKSKFADPTRVVLLEKIDASNCLTCHAEHDPDRTHEMGLTVPIDYCWHCHEKVADDRPSHKGLAFNTCLNAGCHNYHDNSALYENFLLKHADEPALLESMVVKLRAQIPPEKLRPLSKSQLDAPPEKAGDEQLLDDWVATSHAMHGVNCSACHTPETESGTAAWQDRVELETCQTCHGSQAESFLEGKHGMRLAAGLSALSPADARLPMQHESLHKSMNCSACHAGHRFDTRYAAVEACLSCHKDEHSLAYKQSSHFELWQHELSGEAAAGSGVSCATCHMPRIEDSNGKVTVNHNQNWNLEPREKMARSVCMNCHGLGFTLDSLASPESVSSCYATTPAEHVPSIEMARKWFEEKSRKKANRSALGNQ